MRAVAGVERVLGRIPIPLRTVLYALSFLGTVLVALPWLFDRAARAWLPWHPELGRLREIGWVLAVMGLLGYVASAYHLTRRGAGSYVEFDPPTRLVVSGPYARCRNPVALCLLLTLAGVGLGLSSMGVFLLLALAVFLARLQVRAIEEPRLRRRFGPDYERYAERVPRWNPFASGGGPT